MAEGDLDLVRGAVLQAARLQRGLTQLKLSRLAHVSRKHIADAERGKNLSCDVLKKLMKTLNMTEITFGDVTIRTGSARMEPAMLVTVAEATAVIGHALENIGEALGQLQAALREQSSAPASAHLNAKAASLIRNFTDHVRTRTPDELNDVEEVVVGLVESKPARSSRPARRRRRTA